MSQQMSPLKRKCVCVFVSKSNQNTASKVVQSRPDELLFHNILVFAKCLSSSMKFVFPVMLLLLFLLDVVFFLDTVVFMGAFLLFPHDRIYNVKHKNRWKCKQKRRKKEHQFALQLHVVKRLQNMQRHNTCTSLKLCPPLLLHRQRR